MRSLRRSVLEALLRKVREDKDMRQIDVAKALGVPQSFVSKYESGERRLDLIELEQVATALDEPLENLIRSYIDAANR